MKNKISHYILASLLGLLMMESSYALSIEEVQARKIIEENVSELKLYGYLPNTCMKGTFEVEKNVRDDVIEVELIPLMRDVNFCPDMLQPFSKKLVLPTGEFRTYTVRIFSQGELLWEADLKSGTLY